MPQEDFYVETAFSNGHDHFVGAFILCHRGEHFKQIMIALQFGLFEELVSISVACPVERGNCSSLVTRLGTDSGVEQSLFEDCRNSKFFQQE